MAHRAQALVITVFTPRGTHAVPVGTRSRVTIGRAEDNDLRIDDTSVSRHHAVLHLGDRIVVEDLRSANGTRVIRARGDAYATTRVHEREIARGSKLQLEVGDSLSFGATLAVLGTRAAEQPSAKPDVIVADARMRDLYALAARVAAAPISVLILGETGAGKEVLASYLHQASPRATGPFVRLNCAAIPENLVEAELFGHEKGAFTGATTSRPGLCETADRGTLFLDEIGELPLAVQAKLLRVLEQGEVVRVGAREPRTIDVRFISATHQDLGRRVGDGTFRKDLFFRLSGFTLTLPPLRERPTEIESLARTFAEHAARSQSRAVPLLSPDALAALRAHPWPGNVRELKNVVERALVLATGDRIERSHLVFDRLPGGGAEQPREEAEAPLGESLEAIERKRIEDALARCGGNQTRAAELLGISRRTLVYRLAKLGIGRPRDAR